MRGSRAKGDLVLVVPTQAAEDGAMMLLDTPLGKQLLLSRCCALPAAAGPLTRKRQ